MVGDIDDVKLLPELQNSCPSPPSLFFEGDRTTLRKLHLAEFEP